MNETFKEHVTGTAFNLSLSKKMCLALLIEDEGGEGRYRLNVATWRCLEDRGLVSWGIDPKTRKKLFQGITQEGRLVAQLLKRAGMSIHNLTPYSLREVSDGRELEKT